MNKRMSGFITILKDIYFRFKDDDVPALSAQLTYYFILSFFPFLIFLITLVSYTPITNDQVLENFSKVLPLLSHQFISNVLDQIVASDRKTFLSLGMFATIWAASNGMNAVIRGLNKAYDRHETRAFWKVRLISVIATIALAFTILFSFILLILGKVLGEQMFHLIGFRQHFITVWTIMRHLIPLLCMILAFSLLYMLIPNRRMRFKEVIPGSVFTTSGWFMVSILFSIYINNFSDYSVTYGSIGGIIILLIWLYWINIIILLGGELNASLVFLRAKGKQK